MKNRQSNKLRMYRVVEHLLNDNTSKWNTIPAFVSAKNSFSFQITNIHNISTDQIQVTTGIAADKRQMKITLAAEAASLAGVVSVFAVDIGNNELREAVKFTQRALFKCRDHRMAEHCMNIHARALANVLALAPYGVTPALLNAFLNNINSFRAKTPKPRGAQIHRKTLTASLKTNFTAADNLLKLQIDNFMLLFKTTDRGFYTAYKAARVIYDLGQHHTSLRVFVKDKEGNPVQGAMVSLIQNSTSVYVAISNEHGEVPIPRVKPGLYNITVQKQGFTNWSLSEINFISGKKISRTATLSAF